MTQKHAVLRNTFTVAAIMGVGVVAGALLAETSLMNFSLGSARDFSPRHESLPGEVNGVIMPVYSPGYGRHAMSPRGGSLAHHTGL